MKVSVKKNIPNLKNRNYKSSKHKVSDGSKDRVNIIVLFLLIGVIIIMVASVVFNLVFLGNNIIVPRETAAQQELSGQVKGVVTLQIVEPPNTEKGIAEDNVERSVDS